MQKNIIKGIELRDYINKITLTNNLFVNGDYFRNSPENYIFTSSNSQYILSGIPSTGLWGVVDIYNSYIGKLILNGSNPDYSADGVYIRSSSGINGTGKFYHQFYSVNGKYIKADVYNYISGPATGWTTYPGGCWTSWDLVNWEANCDEPNPTSTFYYVSPTAFYSKDLINWNSYSGYENESVPEGKVSYGESKRFINKILITGGQFDNNLYVRTGINLKFDPVYGAPVLANIYPPNFLDSTNTWILADEVEQVYYSYDLINWKNTDEHNSYIVPTGTIFYNFDYGKLTTKKRN